MSKNKIPTFVLELPLVVNEAQEKVVLARLEAARQVYNACLGEALRRRDHLLHSQAYQTARSLPSGPTRTKVFAEARTAVGFGEYDLHEYGAQFGHSWLGEHLASLTVQKLGGQAA